MRNCPHYRRPHDDHGSLQCVVLRNQRFSQALAEAVGVGYAPHVHVLVSLHWESLLVWCLTRDCVIGSLQII